MKYPLLLKTFFGLLLALVANISPAQAARGELVVDLSKPIVAITTGFTGADILLFGVTDGKGDVVVVVRGPQRDTVVRRKYQIAGIWVNKDTITFKQVPGFYGLASNRPIAEFAPLVIRKENQIGPGFIQMVPGDTSFSPKEIGLFKDALIRNKQNQGLYSLDPDKLTFLGNELFRTTLKFPANVTIGTYGIEVYQFRNKKLINKRTTLLEVRKIGFEAGVFNFAHRHSLAYGVIAILIAGMAGWLANAVFRRV